MHFRGLIHRLISVFAKVLLGILILMTTFNWRVVNQKGLTKDLSHAVCLHTFAENQLWNLFLKVKRTNAQELDSQLLN